MLLTSSANDNKIYGDKLCFRCRKKPDCDDRIDTYDEYDRPVCYHTKCYDLEFTDPTPSPQPPRTLFNTRSNRKKARKMKKQGYLNKEIAEKIGCSERTIRRICKQKVKTKYQKNRRLLAERAKQMRESGMLYGTIAEKLGINQTSVSKMIQKFYPELYFKNKTDREKLTQKILLLRKRSDLKIKEIALILDMKPKMVEKHIYEYSQAQ